MPISYVTNALGGTTTTTSFSITLPATAAGDIIILEYTHRGTTDGTIGGTYDGGAFTEKHDQQYATSTFSGKTLWSRATGNHTGQTVTGSSLTNSCAAIITIYRGALASGDPLADATIVGEQNASANETQAQITTTTDGAWVVLVVANSPDVAISSQANTSPGALTERAEVLSTGGTDTSIAHASAEKATAGATGSFTWAQTDGASGSWAYAIKPQPPTYSQTSWRYYADGTETGSTALANQDTNYTADVSSGDVNLQLRVRLQETAGVDEASVSFVGMGAQVTGAGPLTPTYPGGYTAVAGDWAEIWVAGKASADTAPSTPSGYTALGGRRDTVDGEILYVFAKILTASESQPSISLPTNWTVFAVQVAIRRNTDVPTSLDVALAGAQAASATEWTQSAVTTNTNNALVVSGVATSWDNAVGDKAGSTQGFTERAGGASYDIASQFSFAMADVTKAAAGSQTMLTWEQTVNVSNPWAGVTFAIKAASTDDYQLQYELNDSGTYTNVGTSTYHFDASDAGPIDAGADWTNDASAFDGSVSTSATTTISGATLKGEGTNAPGSGGTISQVRARIYGSTSASIAGVLEGYIRTDGAAELLGLPTINGTSVAASYSSYVTLSTPSGGWTWAKIQSLELTFVSDGSGVSSIQAYRAEIEVTHDAVPVVNFNSASLTDGNATTNRLGAGSGSFVAGEISEDGLVDNLRITASNYTELLYSLTIESTAVADADTLDFRVLRNGATTGMTYTVVPRITVDIPAGGGGSTSDFFQLF